MNSIADPLVFFEILPNLTHLQPISLAHESFVTNPIEQPCGTVNELPSNEKCNFVWNTTGCHDNVQYIDYMNFLFCTITVYHPIIYYSFVVLLILQCIYMFTILGITADKFFCPALAVISEIMGLGENIAGVTILAFGNGSPDIFTAIADYDGDTEMLYSELLGAAAFIIGVVSALIMIIRPFTVAPTSFIRDLIFFIFAVIWISYIFKDERISLLEANGTIIIYVFYLIVVIVEHLIIKNKVKNIEIHSEIVLENLANDAHSHVNFKELQEECHFNILKNSNEILTDFSATAHSNFIGNGSNDKLFEQFLNSINPVDVDEWMDAGKFGKLLCLLKIPVIFIMLLIIPIVDYTMENHGWTKLLNSIQILLLPMAIVFFKKWHFKTFAGLSIFLYICIFALPIMILIFFTSRTDRPPKYHLGFVIFGSFIGSIVVISSIASEVVAVLSTLGIVCNLSNSLLGLSILAWGNSIGDLISNMALARQGYTKMSFAACFGGPMFNTLLGMGIVFNLKLYYSDHLDHKDVFVREGAMGPNCTIFLFMILFFTLLGFLLTKFQARRSIGIFMLITYGIFILFAFLGEFEIIHTYGSDHRNEGEFVS